MNHLIVTNSNKNSKKKNDPASPKPSPKQGNNQLFIL